MMSARKNFDHALLPGMASGLELEYPERLVEPSGWLAHVPFAMWLVGVLKPRIIVELGVHSGNSYCAFLQAAHTSGLDTRCFGIDHWLGDAHAGYFGDEIYQEFRAYHDARYGTFSTLMRSSFADALPYFSDGSIDLLHIDGLHTYEAVSADFTSWLPKVSSRGVALFHDINVREREFGIWQFWEELTSRYPHFEFHHSHGLGIAYLGSAPLTGPLKALFAAGTDEEGERVRRYFVRLGTSLAERLAVRTRAADVDGLKAQVTALEVELTTTQSEVARADMDARALVAAREQARELITALELQLTVVRSELAKVDSNARTLVTAAQSSLEVERARAAGLRAAQEKFKERIDELDQKLHAARGEASARAAEIEAIRLELSSTKANAQALATAQKKSKERIDELDQELDAARMEASARAAQVEAIRLELSSSKANAQALARDLEAKLQAVTLQAQIQASLARQRVAVAVRLQRDLLLANTDKRSYQGKLQQVLNSRTWRLTAPLRRVVIRLRRLRATSRHCLDNSSTAVPPP